MILGGQFDISADITSVTYRSKSKQIWNSTAKLWLDYNACNRVIGYYAAFKDEKEMLHIRRRPLD
jgi:hypothetical protein